MNPARSFGPAVILAATNSGSDLLDEADVFKGHWVFWIGPLGGSVVAAVVHRILGMIYIMLLPPTSKSRV